MMIRTPLSAALVLLALLMPFAACSDRRTPLEARDLPDARTSVEPLDVVTVDCGFPTGTMGVDCGYIEVWENRESRKGRKIPIHFVRAKATGEDPAPDPLVYLAGGPGENVRGSLPGMLFAFGRQLPRRDVILLDQRGTGRSNPLDCVSWDLQSDPAAFQRLFGRDVLDPRDFRTCLEDLRERADLSHYTTSAIADDLEDLRAALGYETLNVMGASYGTRLGLEFLRRHPGSVRAAILIGVAPSFEMLIEVVARDYDDTLDALADDCERDPRCAEHYPEFRAQIREVFERIRAEPVTLDMRNPGTGRDESVTVGYPELVTALRYRLYSTMQSASLPRQVLAAAEGDYRPLVRALPDLLPQLNNSIHEGMWASVICTEEISVADVERAREQSRGTVLGTRRLDNSLEICASWPRGRFPEGFHDPVVSDVPVLLVAGELDPASPLRLAEEAVRHLSRGTLVAVRSRSHWGLGGEPCVDGIVDAFLDAGSGEGIDLSCASQFERPPFLPPRESRP